MNDGDTVPSWPDASGNGHHATQVNTDKQPVYVVMSKTASVGKSVTPQVREWIKNRFNSPEDGWLKPVPAALPNPSGCYLAGSNKITTCRKCGHKIPERQRDDCPFCKNFLHRGGRKKR